MADRRSGPAQPPHLGRIEEDAVREPGPRIQPAALLEIVERPAVVDLLAEAVLVLSLGKMGVQTHVEPAGELGGLCHERGRHRERRTWRKRNLHHGVFAALMMLGHHAFAVGQDRVLVLHHAVGRQAAIALRAVHRAAREQRAHAEPLGDADLDVDRVLEPGRKDIVMIRRRGAAGQQQFRHRDRHAKLQRLGRQPRPHRVERLQPGKQLAVHRGRNGTGQRLIEMMVGVDQARQHHMLAGLEGDCI